jgi:hypothetical protein
MINVIKNFLGGIKWIAAAFVIGAAIGGYVGWSEKAIRIEAAKTESLQDVRKADAQAVNDSRQTELKLQDKKDEVEVRYKTITKEIVKYVPQTVVVTKPAEDGGACPSPVLSVDAVRLLNAARANEDIDPTTLGDEAGQAPTDIGLQELAVSDTEVAKLYNKLAIDHNACVDYVQELIDEQNHQLNH